MRVLVSLAICVGTGVLSQALANDPAPVTPQPQAAMQSHSSATSAPATPAAPFTPDEQLLLARGFRVAQENGQAKTGFRSQAYAAKHDAQRATSDDQTSLRLAPKQR